MMPDHPLPGSDSRPPDSPWLRSLPRSTRQECRAHLAALAALAVETRDYDLLTQEVLAWRTTAWDLEDPASRRQLLGPRWRRWMPRRLAWWIDRRQFVEMDRPMG